MITKLVFAALLLIAEEVHSQDTTTCEPSSTTIINQYYGAPESVNSLRNNTEVSVTVGPQGRPGKRGSHGPRGPIGPAGVKGEKGSEGVCHCEQLQNELYQLKSSLEVDECISSPCQNEGACIDGLLSYKCYCVPGSYGTNCESIATSCEQIQRLYAGKDEGVFLLKPLPDEEPLFMYCDQSSDGGNWMVFQRRTNGQQDFFLGWDDYVEDFGSKYGDFWLGLENLHKLTSGINCEMRVDLEDFNGGKRFAWYSTFSIGPAPGYVLSVGGYKGNAGDSLAYHNGMKFSTKDKEQDTDSSRHCAQTYKGAWWYKSCHNVNLNGMYGYGINDNTGNCWNNFGGGNSLRANKMMFRERTN